MSRLLTLRVKLIGLLMLFALVPTVLVGGSLLQATHQQESQTLSLFEIFAKQLADAIDRNLFERYADAKAFALNGAISSQGVDRDLLEASMNGYVAEYGVYLLMFYVDPDGIVQAVNTADADRQPIASAALVGTRVANEDWFLRVARGEFTEQQPFTATDNRGSTGTVIQDLYIDSRVQTVYPGHSGAVIGFAAPVVRDGQTLGYWYSLVDIAAVEEIFESNYQSFRSLGLASTEMTLLDGNGTIIIDFDPSVRGGDRVVKTDAFMVRNLASDGVTSAIAAVNGETGSMYSVNSRKQSMQASGFSHLVGAMGYPGMNWSVLLRTAREEAAAVPIGQRRVLWIEGALLVVGAIIAGFLLGNRLLTPLVEMTRVARTMAGGDLRQRCVVASQDGIGKLAHAINDLADYLSRTVHVINSGVSDLEKSTNTTKTQLINLSSSANQNRLRSTRVTEAANDLGSTMGEVSVGAGESARRLQSVATGADQMAKTIAEIAESTERARLASSNAVANVSEAEASVGVLSRASEDIDRVVGLIVDIAEQTKLLALNATIEAARAGESGKGFAVVASEVKELAQQTNQATEDIRESIAAIQGSTRTTVSSIGGISATISEVSDIVSGIAAAVEEQSVTTDHIARNITQSAEVVSQMNSSFADVTETASGIAGDISQVSNSVGETDSAMAIIHDDVEALVALSDDLRQAVGEFQVA